MKVKYKVVHKKDRGSIYARCKNYIRYYTPDSVVKEVEGSLGIMVFKTKSAAQDFIYHCDRGDIAEIIRVLPVGKAKVCFKDICDLAGNGRRMERFYRLLNIVDKYRKEGNHKMVQKYGGILFDIIDMPPHETQMYPAVRVLE